MTASFHRYYKRSAEKTLEINLCGNLIESIRKHNLYKKAYCRGISMRLESRRGLDAEVEPGRPNSALVFGIQFKKADQKAYDINVRGYYYKFKINNNSANDQHIIL